MKKNNRIAMAALLITALVTQSFSNNTTYVDANSKTETVYYDGIAFDVATNADVVTVTGSYDGQDIELSYNGDSSASATISEGVNEKDYSLVINEESDVMDDIDIDTILDSDTIDEAIENIAVEDILSDCDINVYDEDNALVDTIKFDGYEGQIAITAAGTASYYLLSAAISVIVTYHAYTVVKSTTKSSNKQKKKRGNPQTINKNKIPNRKNKNKVVKGKNGSLPTKGDPNSSTDLISSETGKMTQRRFYDENGDVCLDVDISHGGNHTFPHIHIWY